MTESRLSSDAVDPYMHPLREDEKLLQRVVTAREFKEYLKHKTVTIQGRRGKSYVLRPFGRTILKRFGCMFGEACIQFSYTTATTVDRMIAEYLLIKNNEKQYNDTANLTNPTLAYFGVLLFLIVFNVTLIINLIF